MPSVLPFGSWPTPITSDLVVAAAVRISGARVDGDDVYWAEARPSEGGRTQIVRRDPDGVLHDLLPDGFDARTAVHEYGGGEWAVKDGVLVFTAFPSNVVHVVEDGAPARPITAEGPYRYAAFAFVPGERTVIAIREDHSESDIECVNTLVRLDLDGDSMRRARTQPQA